MSAIELAKIDGQKLEAVGRRPSRSLDMHPLRDVLTNEVHARPFAALFAPEQISHLAVISNEDGAQADHAQLAALCIRHGVPAPEAGLNHFSQDLGMFRLKWERHTEFTTFTFFQRIDGASFQNPVIQLIPSDWLEKLPRVLVAVNVAISPLSASDVESFERKDAFVQDSLIGARVAGGLATVFTDCRTHVDGFGRILICDHGLSNPQAGRLVQHLLEIETYRMMALLGLPLARDAAPHLARIERELTDIASKIAQPGAQLAEQRLLDHLGSFAGEIERLAARTSYRFGAARAYSAIVESRIAELREEQILQLQTIGEFMERRLLPAIRTCVSTEERIERLSKRVARAGQLLRTRVDIALEAQNRDLLRSVNRRVKLQLSLQHMVEGLSVAAISYYVVGLLAHIIRAAEMLRVPVDHDLATGLSALLVPVVVWSVVHRIRIRLLRRAPAVNFTSDRRQIVEDA